MPMSISVVRSIWLEDRLEKLRHRPPSLHPREARPGPRPIAATPVGRRGQAQSAASRGLVGEAVGDELAQALARGRRPRRGRRAGRAGRACRRPAPASRGRGRARRGARWRSGSDGAIAIAR